MLPIPALEVTKPVEFKDGRVAWIVVKSRVVGEECGELRRGGWFSTPPAGFLTESAPSGSLRSGLGLIDGMRIERSFSG